jgi:hypothetical protein
MEVKRQAENAQIATATKYGKTEQEEPESGTFSVICVEIVGLGLVHRQFYQ